MNFEKAGGETTSRQLESLGAGSCRLWHALRPSQPSASSKPTNMPYFAAPEGAMDQNTPVIGTDTELSPAQVSSEDTQRERERERRISVKNRRKFYLDQHPEYFSSDLELADPLLYDRLIRRFQTPAEREAEGRQKGFSGILEADILRSEAKMEALANPDRNALFTYRRGPGGEILAEEKDEIPMSKEEAYAQWKEVMEWRFLNGEDTDFDYPSVDDNEGMDDKKQMEQDKEDAYFDSEEPSWDLEDGKEPQGETGIQDF